MCSSIVSLTFVPYLTIGPCTFVLCLATGPWTFAPHLCPRKKARGHLFLIRKSLHICSLLAIGPNDPDFRQQTFSFYIFNSSLEEQC